MLNSVTDSGQSRILICRLSHIGDCILTLPMLAALRKAKPHAWIAWATENPAPQLLSGHPDLNELITIPKGWLQRPSSILEVRKRLRGMRFDIAIDPQSLAKSALLAWISGARVRLGFRGQHGRELSTWFNNVLIDPSASHLVDRSLELLKGLGIQPGPPQFSLSLQDSVTGDIDQYLRSRGLEGQRFLVINPGASWPSKRWETDRFAEVARLIFERTQLPAVVTWAGEQELAMATAICAQSEDAAILAPRTDLQQLAALLQKAELFLGCDTGPLHLAAALNTICVGLYGPTRPQDSGAYGPRHYAVQNAYQSGSNRQRRHADNHAMRSIQVDQVVNACFRGLAAARVSESSTAQDSRDQAA